MFYLEFIEINLYIFCLSSWNLNPELRREQKQEENIPLNSEKGVDNKSRNKKNELKDELKHI